MARAIYDMWVYGRAGQSEAFAAIMLDKVPKIGDIIPMPEPLVGFWTVSVVSQGAWGRSRSSVGVIPDR